MRCTVSLSDHHHSLNLHLVRGSDDIVLVLLRGGSVFCGGGGAQEGTVADGAGESYRYLLSEALRCSDGDGVAGVENAGLLIAFHVTHDDLLTAVHLTHNLLHHLYDLTVELKKEKKNN